MEGTTWLVVHFFEENTVEVIPNNWIIENTSDADDKICYFPPPTTASHFALLVSNRCTPKEQWESYEIAKTKAKKALVTDELTSHCESISPTKRRRIRNKKYCNSDSSFSYSSSSSDIDDTVPSEKHSQSYSQSKNINRNSYVNEFLPKSVSSLISSKAGNIRKQKLRKQHPRTPSPQRKKRKYLKSTASDSYDAVDDTALSENHEKVMESCSQPKIMTKSHVTLQQAAPPNHHSESSSKNSQNLMNHTQHIQAVSDESSYTRKNYIQTKTASTKSPKHRSESGPKRYKNPIKHNEHTKEASGTSSASTVSLAASNNNLRGSQPQVVATTTSEDKFRRQVLNRLIKIENIVHNLEEDMLHLLKYGNKFDTDNHEDGTDLQEIIDLLPLAEEENIIKVETLLENKKTFNCFAQYLSRHGGDSAEIMSKQLMYKTMTNLLGQSYSWEGAKGKKIFKTTNTAKAIIEAVHRNKRTQDAGEDIIIKTIKKWLARAKERHSHDLQKNK